MAERHRPATHPRAAVFAPLGDEGRATRVEKRLAEAIYSGVLHDGERLPSEPELAAMFGVATVTAREALVALRSQGLVTTTRGRGGGSFVNRPRHPDDASLRVRLASMSNVDLRDRATLYGVIVAGCAELAAAYADADDVAELRELVPDETDTDAARWRHADAELFLSVAALTQSARMTRELLRLEASFGALVRLPLMDPEHRQAAGERLAALVDAIGAGDGDAARRTASTHVRESVAWLIQKKAALG
ncbi:DNA-binding FadR family transcriptional regulator [Mumia flava]|uniref:DNA-binding FadR family transcriptional regulator n=1 Tax=Mumia flava TaxID=1348852 RepID=A0A0B2BRW8_9ACTN|nr:GntR family transcriptional regulator [Mumia flava]PJJ57475.1 DNA-binding FadR family transcriptional regulator [Mumia flava]